MVQRGHEVTIYTSNYKLSPEYINSLPEAEICVFPTWLSQFKFHVTPDIIKSLRENITKFDIIHLHNHYTFQNIITHHYATKFNIPYVLQPHGSLATTFNRGALKSVYHGLWGQRILKDASGLIAVAPMEAGQYRSMGTDEDKVEIVPHGIDLTEFEDLPPRGEFRREHGLTNRCKLILFLGRIDPVKGLDLLARSFAGLTREMDDARLVIAGPDDGYLSAVKHLIKALNIEESVLFTGPLYGKDKLAAYVDADVFVLPSSYEIFGITVLEALACGTPVIVTDRCGIVDLINKDWARIIQFDENQLKESISRTLRNQRTAGKATTKRFITEKFTWPKVAEQFERVYDSAINTRTKI